MATTYPTTKQSVPNPTGTDLLDNSNAQLDHDYQHSTVNDTIEALQDKVGIDNDPNVDSFDYKLSDIASGEKAISSNGSGQTLTDITLTDPQINFGGDATGDMYYRSAGGVTTRLPIGTAGDILQVDGTLIPEWVANPAASDASTTVKGVSEIATTSEITAGTSTGATGAVLVVPSSAVGAPGASKIVQYTSGGLYPAADGSLITNLAAVSRIAVIPGVTIASSTTPTNLASVTIPANTLGTNGAFRCKIYIKTSQKAGTGNADGLVIKYGGTTLASVNPNNNAATFSGLKGYIEIVVFATGATNSQGIFMKYECISDGVSGTAPAMYVTTSTAGTSAIDSTTNQTFIVEWTEGTNSANDNITTSLGIVEKIA